MFATNSDTTHVRRPEQVPPMPWTFNPPIHSHFYRIPCVVVVSDVLSESILEEVSFLTALIEPLMRNGDSTVCHVSAVIHSDIAEVLVPTEGMEVVLCSELVG